MSGGSYDYLYLKVDDQLCLDGLVQMAETCEGRIACGFEPNGPHDTFTHVEGKTVYLPSDRRQATEEEMSKLALAATLLRAAHDKVEAARAACAELTGIMRAVEWWTSGDTGWDYVVDEVRALQAVPQSGGDHDG